MDIKDYQNNGKYKFFLPIIYIFNWALMFTGPFFYPVAYRYYIYFVFIMISTKSFITCVWALKSIINGIMLCRRYDRKMESIKEPENQQQQKLKSLEASQEIEEEKKLWFAFIIPSYKEDLQLLGDTLRQLAKHPKSAKKYLVFMAMEAHEEGSAQKAQLLIQKYGHHFKLMSYSHHIMRQHEQKGKASNVSWCAERLEEHEFPKLGINPEDVYITVMDSDSWAPHMYMYELEEKILKNPEKALKTIFQPAQTFTRNHKDVPIFSRTYDQSHSAVHFANVSTFFEMAFSLSNYTVSFNLIKKIGFWDTCADAIGQDLHTVIKAFYKTNGDVYCQSILALFNQVNIQTGNGYIADVSARFWQAERHARGCADVAYALKMFLEGEWNYRTIFLTYHVLQTFLLPTMIPFVFVGDMLINIVFTYFPQPEGLLDPQLGSTILNYSTIFLLSGMFLFFVYYRFFSAKYYGLQKESFMRFLEYLITFFPNLICITIPSFIIAAFKVVLNKSEYNVAEKMLKTNTNKINDPLMNSETL